MATEQAPQCPNNPVHRCLPTSTAPADGWRGRGGSERGVVVLAQLAAQAPSVKRSTKQPGSVTASVDASVRHPGSRITALPTTPP